MTTPPYIYEEPSPVVYDQADLTYEGQSIDDAAWAWQQAGV